MLTSRMGFRESDRKMNKREKDGNGVEHGFGIGWMERLNKHWKASQK